ATENPDLYWAMRGGTGNFGIATEFECRLFDLPPVTTGWMFFTIDDAPKAIATCNQVMQRASNDLSLWCYIDMPATAVGAQTEQAGRRGAAQGQTESERVLGIRVVFTGDPARLDEQLEELRASAPPLGEQFALRDYQELSTELDAMLPPAGFRFMFS